MKLFELPTHFDPTCYRESEIIGNANFCNIDNLLSQDQDMDLLSFSVFDSTQSI